MSFKQALKILNIEDYAERIWNSNSHGELFYIYDYIELAKYAQTIKDPFVFRDWFVVIVKHAEDNWKRPESIFQHIPQALEEWLKKYERTRRTNKV